MKKMKKYFKHSSHKMPDATRYAPIVVRDGKVRLIEKISFEKEKDVREYLEKVELQDELVGYVRLDTTETYYLTR